jgi:hypothetical protein
MSPESPGGPVPGPQHRPPGKSIGPRVRLGADRTRAVEGHRLGETPRVLQDAAELHASADAVPGDRWIPAEIRVDQGRHTAAVDAEDIDPRAPGGGQLDRDDGAGREGFGAPQIRGPSAC